MILADKRDYKCGYSKHYAAYKKLNADNATIRSRRLLLIYSVECGLKYLLLDKWNEDNPSIIISNTTDSRHYIIKTHNLEKILRELGQTGTFSFPQLKTNHGDTVISDNFHELCRYGIYIHEKDRSKEENYETELKKLAEWINERMVRF